MKWQMYFFGVDDLVSIWGWGAKKWWPKKHKRKLAGGGCVAVAEITYLVPRHHHPHQRHHPAQPTRLGQTRSNWVGVCYHCLCLKRILFKRMFGLRLAEAGESAVPPSSLAPTWSLYFPPAPLRLLKASAPPSNPMPLWQHVWASQVCCAISESLVTINAAFGSSSPAPAPSRPQDSLSTRASWSVPIPLTCSLLVWPNIGDILHTNTDIKDTRVNQPKGQLYENNCLIILLSVQTSRLSGIITTLHHDAKNCNIWHILRVPCYKSCFKCPILKKKYKVVRPVSGGSVINETTPLVY